MATTLAAGAALKGISTSLAVDRSGRQPQFLAGEMPLHRSLQNRHHCRIIKRDVQGIRSMAAQGIKEKMLEEMAIEKRLQAQVSDGKVKSLSPKEAGYAVKLSNYTLLDVRPSVERNKAYVKQSVHIPMYEVEKKMDPGSLSKKLTNFVFAGWWDGSKYMTCNERFMPDVASQIRNKEQPIVVACQKGLRSLAACEAMRKAGYKNLYWLTGGFEAADDADFEREGPKPFKYAGIGGISEFLGWTDLQRREAKKDPGLRLTSLGRLAIIFLLADGLFVASQQLFSALNPEQ